MTQSTSGRAEIDPLLKMLLDAVPMTFTASDGVEVARARLAALKAPPELLPDLRIEDRRIGYGEHEDIPVRIYWPPTAAQEDLPVVVFYHGGGWALGSLDTHDHVARAHAVGAEAFWVNDGSVRSPMQDGYHSSWKTRFGPPASRAS
ncbi:alpha/beta hydrolase [Mycobacterium asiaticum]|uniref:alpha/beta hydrolase n=1 Tax=Mycobacterium asiaticum TaxID=1790 RepID=UPI0012DB2CC5